MTRILRRYEPRFNDDSGALTVATRLPLGLAAAGGWGDTALDLPDKRLLLDGPPQAGRLCRQACENILCAVRAGAHRGDGG